MDYDIYKWNWIYMYDEKQERFLMILALFGNTNYTLKDEWPNPLFGYNCKQLRTLIRKSQKWA